MQDGPRRLIRRAAEKHKVKFAREQRREATRSEERLWQELRGKRLGVRFRRQHPIGKFVIDFFCNERRLAVEIDGPVHEKQQGYDRYRDEWLAEQGIRVLRIPDEDVTENISGVLDRIREALK
ncbi:MAG: endonuclease domain-containing protein [candidate division WS1 bacterium]|jgi:very-short-patch-repair endonuclease|nr:endonuclease domain-containing protein [candidate division WS1 bacterium]